MLYKMLCLSCLCYVNVIQHVNMLFMLYNMLSLCYVTCYVYVMFYNMFCYVCYITCYVIYML